MKEFTPAYLSGFYGDTADVDSAVYKPDAEETAFTSTVDSINKVPAFRGYSIKRVHRPHNPSTLQLKR